MGILSFTCRSTMPRNLEPLVKGHLIVPHMCIINIPPSKPPPLCMPWVGFFGLGFMGYLWFTSTYRLKSIKCSGQRLGRSGGLGLFVEANLATRFLSKT